MTSPSKQPTERIEREPLCPVKWCPRRSDPDFHVCWICGAIATEHHHVRPRGMGGSKSRKKDSQNIIALCHGCHEKVTMGEWGCAINHVPGKGLVFWAWKPADEGRTYETIVERVLEAESSAVEAGPTGPRSQTPARPRGLAQDERPSAALPPLLRLRVLLLRRRTWTR